MDVIKTAIDGVLILEPKVFGDNRGYFFESFSQREFDEKVAPILGHTIHFVQDNESMSIRCDEGTAFPTSSFYPKQIGTLREGGCARCRCGHP